MYILVLILLNIFKKKKKIKYMFVAMIRVVVIYCVCRVCHKKILAFIFSLKSRIQKNKHSTGMLKHDLIFFYCHS